MPWTADDSHPVSPGESELKFDLNRSAQNNNSIIRDSECADAIRTTSVQARISLEVTLPLVLLDPTQPGFPFFQHPIHDRTQPRISQFSLYLNQPQLTAAH